MGHYLPTSETQRQEMCQTLGISSLDELYGALPADLLLPSGPAIPNGQGELGTLRAFSAMAAENRVFSSIFRGAGAYRHYIPAIVSSIPTKETLLTAYTPYQPEIAQGILQSIFEYQSMICQLTGLDAANASVYDGATAAAEAAAMCRDRKRQRSLVSAAANPQTIEVMKTYCWATGCPLDLIPAKDGKTDPEALAALLGPDVAGVYLEQCNFFGQIEDAASFAAQIHAAGAKLILGINPIAAGLLCSAADCGADIAVGEGQPLGMPLSFGGPYLGFMAASEALTRKLPGRIAGETVDDEGRRAFVLTLQAREQHIRREKASSNICSNQALCATVAAAYLATLGPTGLREVAEQCYHKAHYLAEALSAIPGFSLRHGGSFFHEFVTECPLDPDALMQLLEQRGILGGLPLSDGGILWCATEMNSREEMDTLVQIIKEVSAR